MRLARLSLLIGAAILAGCTSLWPSRYGELAADADPVRRDGKPNVMPSNAPSTLNGHWADVGGHQGIDILGPAGTPILAPADGQVLSAYFEPMYGHTVVLEHGMDGEGNAIRSLFVHLDERLVKLGDRVSRGQQIATLGRTGLLAIAIPHLHFEILSREPRPYRIHESVNPNRFWMDGAGIVTCFDKGEDYPAMPFRITYPVPCRGIKWR